MQIVQYGLRPLGLDSTVPGYPIYRKNPEEIADEFYKLQKRIKELESYQIKAIVHKGE
mgnify:CR=1 FL=1